MILHGFAWRNSKNKVLKPKNVKFESKSQTHPKKIQNNFKIHENICFPKVSWTLVDPYGPPCGMWPSLGPYGPLVEELLLEVSSQMVGQNMHVQTSEHIAKCLERGAKGARALKTCIFTYFFGFVEYFWSFGIDFKVFGREKIFLGLLQAKPCRII